MASEFETYTATVEDDDGNKRTDTVEARKVEETEDVETTDGPKTVRKGQYVVKTGNNNIVDVLDAKDFSDYSTSSKTDTRKVGK